MWAQVWRVGVGAPRAQRTHNPPRECLHVDPNSKSYKELVKVMLSGIQLITRHAARHMDTPPTRGIWMHAAHIALRLRRVVTAISAAGTTRAGKAWAVWLGVDQARSALPTNCPRGLGYGLARALSRGVGAKKTRTAGGVRDVGFRGFEGRGCELRSVSILRLIKESPYAT